MLRVFLLLILIFPVTLSARVSIYLIPEVQTYNSSLTLSDIAGIEGEHAEQAGSLAIPQSLYKDFIVDRRELNDFLALSLMQSFAVFGNGVKITFNNKPDDSLSIKTEKPVLVKKGDYVKLVVRSKGITIEMTGKSLDNGTADDEISVRLKNGKVLKGKPVCEGRVAVLL